MSSPPSSPPAFSNLDSASTITSSDEWEQFVDILHEPIGFDDNFDTNVDGLLGPGKTAADFEQTHGDDLQSYHGATEDFDGSVYDGQPIYPTELDFTEGQWRTEAQTDEVPNEWSESERPWELSNDVEMLDVQTQDIGNSPITERLFRPTTDRTNDRCKRVGLPLKSHSSDSVPSSSPPRALSPKASPPPGQTPQKQGFKCKLCNTKFKRESDIPRHVSTKHSDVFSFACKLSGCGEKFKRKDKAREHCLKHHEDAEGFVSLL